MTDIIRKKEAEKYLKKDARKRRQLKAGSVASDIISTIASVARSAYDLAYEIGESDFNNLFAYPTLHPEMRRRKYSAAEIRGGWKSLERGGYVHRDKGKRTVFLTEKAIQEILKYRMKNKGQEGPWDGKWRIIIFDIKESTRKDRNFLRRQLKWIGFRELQKSVWVFPYEVRDELKEFMRLCMSEFQGDVRFILADRIDSDASLKKEFGITV